MKTIITIAACLFIAGLALAEELAYEGSYTTKYKNDRPNKLNGSITSKGSNEWAGTFTTDWKGKTNLFQGIITGDLKKGDVKGDFHLMTKGNPGRHFLFTAKADNYTIKGSIIEMKGTKEDPCGDFELKKK